jgi:hypothetical protein
MSQWFVLIAERSLAVKTCKLHNTKFSAKSPNTRGEYWHVIDFAKKEFCSVSAEIYNALPEEEGESTIPAPSASSSFNTCNAMNNAIALINADKVPLEQLEVIYRRILEILES